jgi:hypothetical protein
MAGQGATTRLNVHTATGQTARTSPGNGGRMPGSGLRQNMAAYYKSPHWRRIRQSYLDSKLWDGKCEACDSETRSPHVHHRSYKRLGNEWLMDLVGLCPGCHAWVHHLAGEHHGKSLWDTTRRVIRAKGTNSPYRSPLLPLSPAVT